MENQDHTSSRRPENRYRPFGEIVRGIFFLLFGLFVFYGESIGLGSLDLAPLVVNILGTILLLYGLFRIINGVRKLYFNRK